MIDNNFKLLSELIKLHMQIGKEEADRWDELLRWYNGEFRGGETSAASTVLSEHTNLLFPLVESMSAVLAPTNPRFHAKARGPGFEDQSLYAERLLMRDLQAASWRKVLRKTIRRTIITGRSPVKTVWNDKVQAPRVYDVPPRRLWWDFDMPFTESPYYIEATFVSANEMRRRMKNKSIGYNEEGFVQTGAGIPGWLHEANTRGSKGTDLRRAVDGIFKKHLVFEVVFPHENRCIHIMLDAEKPLLDGACAYTSVRNPYTMLAYNDNLVDERGIADAQLIRMHQQRLNELNQLAVEHILRSMPWTAYDSSQLDEDEVGAIEEAGPGDLIGLKPSRGKSLRDCLFNGPTPMLSPDFHRERARVDADLRFVVGLPEWIRGQITGAETATDVALTEDATRDRFAQRNADTADMTREVVYRMLLLRQEMMSNKERVFLEDPASAGTGQEVTVEDLMAISDMEVVPHNPEVHNRIVRREALKRLYTMFASTGADRYIDMPRLAKTIVQLHDEDPSLVSAGPLSPAEAEAAAMQNIDMTTGAM